MLNRTHLATLTEVLAVSSITALGFAIGNPIATEALKGIGLNLASNILQKGCTKLKESWFLSRHGILNHDIQFAFSRAFAAALTHMENDYLRREDVKVLPKEQRREIENLFRELRDNSEEIFVHSPESAFSEEDLQICLYADRKTSQKMLDERVETNLATYDSEIRKYFQENLQNLVLFYFGEELKKDTEESNKAWRAFQRLLLEGLRSDLLAVREKQDLIFDDLKRLDTISADINLIKSRLRPEILDSLAADIRDIKENVHEIHHKVTRMAALMDERLPPQPPPFDEAEFRREYNELFNRTLFASPYELERLKYDVQHLRHKYPHHPDVNHLDAKVNHALSYERSKMMMPTASAAPAQSWQDQNRAANQSFQPPQSQKRLGFLPIVIGIIAFFAVAFLVFLLLLWLIR